MVPPTLLHLLYWKTILAIMKAWGLRKSQNCSGDEVVLNLKKLQVQSRIFKNPNFQSLLWIWKNLEVYTLQDQHFRIQILNGLFQKKLEQGVEDMEYPVVLKKGIEKCQSVKKCSRISRIVQEKVIWNFHGSWFLTLEFRRGVRKF